MFYFQIASDHILTVNFSSKILLQKFRAHAFAKPVHRRIRVKAEPGISTQSNARKVNGKLNVVKVEPNAQTQQKEAAVSHNGKETLINKIVSLKSENQQLVVQLRNEQTEKTALESKLHGLEQQINKQSAEMNALRAKLSEESATNTKMCALNDEKISNLLRAKDLLEARNKQLQKGVDQKRHEDASDEDDDVYEVEKLIDHVMDDGVRYYLVRWMGYNNKRHDTWEKESNLSCPDILNAYNASIPNEKK